MSKNQTCLLCNNFGKKECPHKDHDSMQTAIMVQSSFEFGVNITASGSDFNKTNKLCKDCDKFIHFSG